MFIENGRDCLSSEACHLILWRGHVLLLVVPHIDYVNKDKSSRMKSKMYEAVLSVQIQPNESKHFG